MPSRLWEVAPSAPAPARWAPLRAAAAGILAGVLLGAGGTFGLRALTAPAGPPPSAPGVSEASVEKGTSAAFTRPGPAGVAAGEPGKEVREFGDFLDAAEIVNTGVTALPWADPVGSALLLNRIVQGLEMQKELEKAEKAKPAIRKEKPEVAALADDVIGGQKDVLLCLSEPNAISPEEVQKKAELNLARIDAAKQGLRLQRRDGHRRGPGRGRPGPRPGMPGDVAAMVEGLVKELEGDEEGANAIYVNFQEKFPGSRLRFFALAREMEAFRQSASEEQIFGLVKQIPGFILAEEMPPAVENQIRVIVHDLQAVKPEFSVVIRRAMDESQRLPFRHPVRQFRSVRLNEVEVPEAVRRNCRGVLYSLSYSLGKEWNMESRTEDKVKRVEYTKRDDRALGLDTHHLLGILTKDLAPRIEPEAVTRVSLEGEY
jgi:hypothetical protein